MNLNASMAQKRKNASLSKSGSRTTLRLRALMEHQQKIEIGERIRTLREASPHTNASIAEHVGVGERAVANWMSGGTGIQWENAKKVAELFDVDVNWLWTGQEHRPGPTPDPFSPKQIANDDLAQQIELQLREILAGQLELSARVSRVERLLEDQQKQKQPASRRRKAGS